MRDLIDAHRTNIAKAGVALAEAINEATTTYTLAVAASEAALELQIEKRVAQFHGDPTTTSLNVAGTAPGPTTTSLTDNRFDTDADRE